MLVVVKDVLEAERPLVFSYRWKWSGAVEERAESANKASSKLEKLLLPLSYHKCAPLPTWIIYRCPAPVEDRVGDQTRASGVSGRRAK